jgi:hypothetical protein
MSSISDKTPKCRLRARITEFAYPPVHDGLVIGKQAPLGLESFRKAMSLLMTSSFEHIEVEDDIIGDLLVRTAVLRRISSAKLLAFVLQNVKPLMSGEEILHLDLHAEIEIEEDPL